MANANHTSPAHTSDLLTAAESASHLLGDLLNLEYGVGNTEEDFDDIQDMKDVCDELDKAIEKTNKANPITKKEKYELAVSIISDLSSEWDQADDSLEWQKENVEEYAASMSFDELESELRAITFRDRP